jgi:hypothetical protein
MKNGGTGREGDSLAVKAIAIALPLLALLVTATGSYETWLWDSHAQALKVLTFGSGITCLTSLTSFACLKVERRQRMRRALALAPEPVGES